MQLGQDDCNESDGLTGGETNNESNDQDGDEGDGGERRMVTRVKETLVVRVVVVCLFCLMW